MPTHRISMRKFREVLRLAHQQQCSTREIAAAVRLSHTTVHNYLQRAAKASLTWPLPEDLAHSALEARLFPKETAHADSVRRPVPDWPAIHEELKAKGVTKQLLWEEYRQQHPDGYGYSWFCERYRDWKKTQDLVMRQYHAPGDQLFVDYAGKTVEVYHPEKGENVHAQIFVAVLGYSNYTYAEATGSQSSRDWIASHCRAFEYFGAVPAAVVPDNLKAAVRKAHRYDPELNPAYSDLARHYGITVLPARVRKPRDKAKVEAGVLVVERQILAPMRKQRFPGLDALNAAIADRLEQLNDKPLQKQEGSRRTRFIDCDRPAMQPLPAQPFVLAEWKKFKVRNDYHISFDRHHYSVPHQYAHEKVEVRVTDNTVEVFHDAIRIASHRRKHTEGTTTVAAHQPLAHQAYDDPKAMLKKLAQVGTATERMACENWRQCPHPQKGKRALRGLLALLRTYGSERLERACQLALDSGTLQYRYVSFLLKNRREEQNTPASTRPAIEHENIRGADYYAQNTPEKP